MKNERYTEAQKLLLRFDPSTFSEQERYIVRRAMLPRKRYVPQTDEEGEALAHEILGDPEYERFAGVRADISRRYGAEGRWSAGDHRWNLLYRFSADGKALCALAMSLNLFELLFTFGKREMEAFERIRSTFSRAGIQWTYDMSVEKNGRKLLSFDLRDLPTYEEVFRLLALRCKPKTARNE